MLGAPIWGIRPRRMRLRQLLHKPVSLWLVLGVIALAFAAWLAVFVRPNLVSGESILAEGRGASAVGVGMDLITMGGSSRLDAPSLEFAADLLTIREGRPWVEGDRLRPGDPKRCVRIIITNEQGQAWHLLLQEKEHQSEGPQFRLLSYTKITRPVAPPNGGPTQSVGGSGAAGGRHR